MAYCLGNLIGILERILYPEQHHKKWVLDHHKVSQIQSLLENVCFLKEFLANSTPQIQARIETLEDEIRDAADKAEDILESHITNKLVSSYGMNQKRKKIISSNGVVNKIKRIISSHGSLSFTISPPDLWDEIEVFECAKKKMIKIKDVSQRNGHDTVQRTANKSHVVSSWRDPNPTNVVVGVTEDLKQLRDRLTRQSCYREIIPIVGMGGMGKTTLARILYDEFSCRKSHFDVCAWVKISQDYSPQGVLQGLLDCIVVKPTNDMVDEDEEEEDSGLILHKKLFGRRYLIVLDDIWSSKAWDDVQIFFPHTNGSRIILTTRENDVADYVNSKSHVMHLLSQADSWQLLRKKVYGEESCPLELEEAGQIIANKCRGLPLAVQVIGGILSQAERNIDIWEQVSSNVSSTLEDADDQFSGIFSLSYAHLPHYLKPCFLYMGAFPEDHKIPASKLINLWVAEGFLNPIGDKSQEEAAKIYLKALVDRNLIFVLERKSNGGVKSYGIHDLLRDQCLKKAREKKFLNVMNLQIRSTDDPLYMRRVIVHSERRALNMDTVGQMKLARSFIWIGHTYKEHLSPVFLAVSLLRVLDVLKITFPEFPEEILKLVNLRYLAFRTVSRLPSISTFRNLQTLIIEFGIFSERLYNLSAKKINLPQLRHIKLFGVIPPCPLIELDKSPGLRENLQSLSTILVSTLTPLLGKFPNLVKLGICGETSTTDTVDLTCFHKLETLECSSGMIHRTGYFSPKLIFPVSVKKLTLDRCTIPQSFLNAVGRLSNLEILKLRFCFMESSTWEPSGGEFSKLQYLELTGLELEDWFADETHFPELRHLVIHNCRILNEIPLEIGGIDTLEIIEVDDINPSVLESARRIIHEQFDLGNNLLQLCLYSPSR